MVQAAALLPGEADAPPGAKEEIVRRREIKRAQYEEGLSQGRCYWFFRSGGSIAVDAYVAAFHLPRTLKVLRSDKPKDAKLATLRRAGWHFYVGDADLELLVANFFAPKEAYDRLAALGESLLRVGEFGTTVGTPIDSGFVFVDGQYLDAPYRVTRRGLGLFINEKLIEPPMRWPWPQTQPAGSPTDPKLPVTITKETSQWDLLVLEYLSAKRAYVWARYSQNEVPRQMAEVYKGLPCVDTAELDAKRPEVLVVTWSDGSVERIRLRPFGRRPIKHDKKSVLARLEGNRTRWENRLRKGDYYLFFTDGGEISGGAAGATEILSRLVPILRSSEADDVKFRQIEEAGLPAITRDNFATMVTDFAASQQLDKRLEEIAAPKEEPAPDQP